LYCSNIYAVNFLNFTCINQRNCNIDGTLTNLQKVAEITLPTDTAIQHTLLRCQTDPCQEAGTLLIENVEYVCYNQVTLKFKPCSGNNIALPIADLWDTTTIVFDRMR
jgi:hypothetical protein